MKIYRNFEEIQFNPNRIVTVGTFDGVHLGHQKILQRLNEIARSTNGTSLIITFDPHPQFVVKRADKEPLKLLTTIEERLFLFEKFGIGEVLIIPFTLEFAQTSAEEFIRFYLHQKVGFSWILVGHDHFFGRNREGNFDLLIKLSSKLGFGVNEFQLSFWMKLQFPAQKSEISSPKIKLSLQTSYLVTNILSKEKLSPAMVVAQIWAFQLLT